MRCRRCGEDNLPGLASCLGCGWTLSADPAAVELPTRPRVRAANPLAAGPARPRRPAGAWIRAWKVLVDAALWSEVVRILWALLCGLLVGLGPWRRGDRRTAGLLLAALGGCVLAGVALWTSALQPVAWVGALTVLATSGYIEARARVPRGVAGGSVPIALFAASMALLVHVALAFAFDTSFPRVIVGATPALAGGSFLVERVTIDELSTDDLVAVGEATRLWRVTGQRVQVGPVLALPGQHVDRVEGGFLVDGAPAAVHFMNPRTRILPGLPAGGIDVPEGRVAVLVNRVRVLPAEGLVGRLTYRWTPAADRGPIDWPPPGAPETP